MVASVVPTAHLVSRCKERFGDLPPDMEVGRVVHLHGVLIVDTDLRCPCKLYLDVDGIGRFVLAQEGDKFVGVTFLPRVYCHDPQLAEALVREG